MQEKREKRKSILDIYKGIFLGHPLLMTGFTVIYALLLLGYYFRTQIRETLRPKNDAQVRISELEKRVAQEEALIEALTRRPNSTSFFRDLNFQENWKSDENRKNVLRLLEYANFAIQKGDYSRAESLYQEASQIQETISVPYQRSRLSYLQGDLQSGELQLRRIIELDSSSKYPDLRLYLAIVLYQAGKEKEGRDYLRRYLTLIGAG